ncbi:MAG: hypothetical protein WC516_08510 [Patescibacteria group bacterium]|jgi:hypothetical protein
MSKRAFGGHYYSMSDSYPNRIQAEYNATKIRKTGKYLVRVAKSGFGKGNNEYAVYVREK